MVLGSGEMFDKIAARYDMMNRVLSFGLDPSREMLAVAEQKIAKRQLAGRVTLVHGDAQSLPYGDAELDATTIAFGIRNVPDRAQGLRELARVVRPGGRVAVLELGEPRRGVMSAAARFHTHHVVPRLGALLSGAREYRYLEKSIAAFPPRDDFAAMMRASGLEVILAEPLTFGVCTLYVSGTTSSTWRPAPSMICANSSLGGNAAIERWR